MAYDYKCGDFVPTPLSIGGAGGSSVPFFITGTDPAIGGGASQIVDMTTEAGDFVPTKTGPGGTFLLIIETDAPIKVLLPDGSDYTISQAMATAYLGTPIPMLVVKVYKSGTTGTFSVGR